MSQTRRFHLGDVLSVTFGVLVSPRLMDGVYDTLNFLTGDSLYTHQLPRAGRTVAPYVMDQHPHLAPVADAIRHVTGENWRAWLDEQIAVYGETLELAPLPTGAWMHVDALDELETMVPNDSIVVIDAQ